MADGNFLEKAIQFVKQARDEDEKENYQEAYRLYLVSLDWFMAAIKCSFPTFPWSTHPFHAPLDPSVCVFLKLEVTEFPSPFSQHPTPILTLCCGLFHR